MAISDIYASGVHKRNLGHFANIVKLALSDNQISENEQHILMRLKKRLEIGDAEFDQIMKNPASYPINPPVDRDRRLERFYNLVSIIQADEIVRSEEIVILKKIAIGLGFTTDKIEALVEKAIALVTNNSSQEDFVEEMKKE
ncbi:tellurite resistance TerB family protein [Flavicella sediminum]|uniref:tellurite resistance TerB family protein n=1 Tax=Flavicella sediminum TaxID=2585141 RepID=UPI001123E1B0|nr:TerB family tellurite resistance protein [Flavicella sediminum]